MARLSRPASGGFTLIEVMIALAVIAIAMGAIVATSSQFTRTADYLRQKTFASWVAENAFTQIEDNDPWPSTGQQHGQQKMGGQNWHWTADISGTPDQDLRRVDVHVSPADSPGRVIATVTGFLGRHPLVPSPSSQQSLPNAP
ncbi:MAG TPA: type II secretion system minor pseudopilin GspI [Gammaproteobacteria bacterium]|nr:type II secretion system minor pseudopilin GspI [Gammaproteobacteria bacterium]